MLTVKRLDYRCWRNWVGRKRRLNCTNELVSSPRIVQRFGSSEFEFSCHFSNTMCVSFPRSTCFFPLIETFLNQRAEFDLLNLKNTAPNEFNVNFLLGKLYIQLNRRAEATKYFAFAQELAPSNGAAIREQLESKGQQDDSTGISQNDIAGMELDDR